MILIKILVAFIFVAALLAAIVTAFLWVQELILIRKIKKSDLPLDVQSDLILIVWSSGRGYKDLNKYIDAEIWHYETFEKVKP